MRLKAIYWIFLACLATALTSETERRPKRHLHEIKQLIANKLFARPEPNCTVPQPNQPGVRFFRIPGFNDVVIKAVPKGLSVTPPPLIEKIPPNSQIGVVGSYLGTHTLNETYNALLGVKNLFKSGILEAKHEALQKLIRKPTNPLPKPVTPCPSPEAVNPPTSEPIGVVVKPPVVPIVAPTRYSYKQVNQDGSVTTWSSFLDFNQGVKVTEDGKTLPFIIDRIRRIPVQLPVPVLPEVSKIVVPVNGNFGRYPVKVIQPDSSYSYKQVNRDGSLTTYTGLPSFNNNGGPVVVTGTDNIPPPAFFLEKVPVSSSFSRAPMVDIIVPKPMSFDAPAGPVVYETPVIGSPLPAPPSGYSFTQIYGSGGKTIAHQAAGPFSKPPLSAFPSIPNRNPFEPVRVASYAGIHESSVQEPGSDFSASEPLAYGIQPPGHSSFLYSAPSSHFNDRKDNVADEVTFNRIQDSTMPLIERIAHPVPNDFVHIPSVQASAPQKPVKPPSASGTSPFLYKHIHRDGSVTTYDGDGSMNEDVNTNHLPTSAMPIPQGNTRVFESPIYPGPFPIEVNTNAFKPSSPVSGAYSYKLLNNGQVDYHYDVGADEAFLTPGWAGNEPFPVPPVVPVAPVPVQGCVDPEVPSYPNSLVGQYSGSHPESDPPSFSYTQPAYYQPTAYQTVSAENPAMAANNANKKIRDSNQHQYYSNAYHNVNEDYYINPKDYVYIPPERYDEIPPPIKPLHLPRLPPKKFSNRFLYENFDGYNFRDENTNLPPTTPKRKENLSDNVYGEQVQYNRRSIFNNRNSVTNNNMMRAEPVSTPKSPADSVYVEPIPVQIPFNSQPNLSNRNPEFDNLSPPPEQVSIPNYQADSVYVEPTPVQISFNSQPTTNRNPAFNNPSPTPEQVSIPDYPVDIVYNERLPSSPGPILSNQNSLNANPIMVQEKSSFSFKQSNPDGFTITTTNDGGNTLSVQVEEFPRTQAVQEEESHDDVMGIAETPGPVDEVTSTVPVPVYVEETSEPEPVSSTEMPKRRKIKRVKVKHNRGDIPDTD